jgi:post-segregation antitoxin (ccd killing protein)
VTTQISTIELNPELVNMAYEMGLNVSKTCENALKEAIRRLQGFNTENLPVRNAEAAGSNPARSTFARAKQATCF